MIQDHPDLGEFLSVHRPTTARIWLMALMALALLSIVVIVVLIVLTSLTAAGNSKGVLQGNRVGALICVAVPAFLLLLICSFLIKDFRKRLVTRTSKLTIFKKGFTYESEGRNEACQWNDITDITYRRADVFSKHSAPRRVNLIRSIVKKDGEMISLPQTLNLTRITRLIDLDRLAEYSERRWRLG